jgi:hypothetical protein
MQHYLFGKLSDVVIKSTVLVGCGADNSNGGLLVPEGQKSVLQHWHDLLDIFMLEIYISNED